MAYILSKVGQSFNVPVHIYEADTEEDMNSIDIQDVPMGSKCHIINNDKWYMLNSDGKWKAMPKQVQPDWNQNDDTAADYVKNRPFYTGDPVETVLVEESTVTFTENKGLYQAQFPSTFEATVGDTYKVSWDGTVYECTCVDTGDIDGGHVIGNLSIVGLGSDTGEPFVMAIANGERIEIATADTSASHTFSISRIIQEVVKIDPKYIRDMYYTTDPVETVLAEESTVPFSFSESDGAYIARFQSTFSVTVGDTYKVSWDGTVYECTCVLIKNLPVIGNLSIIGVGSDTGEPFLIVVGNGREIKIATADASASHTISISGYIESVVKINPKYLPMASKTEPGIVMFDDLANGVLQQVKNEYFTPTDFQVSGYEDSEVIKKYADKNNGYGVYIPGGKSGGVVLSCYNNITNKYITSVLAGGADIKCYKISQGSSNIEQLWGISEDGVIIPSSTANSTKKFKITVDDSGTLTATEVT